MLATSFGALSSLGAVVLDLENTTRLRERYLPDERSWIDRAELEDVALLQSASGLTGDTYLQLFWNRSVTSLLMPPGVAAPDAYRVERVSIARDGTFLSGGKPVVRPLVIDELDGPVELVGAVPVASAPTHRLWRPTAVPRLSFMTEGYFDSGWLGRSGTFRVWPSTASRRLAGRVSFRATSKRRTALIFQGAFGRREYQLAPGTPTTIAIPVCGRGPWTATFRSTESRWHGGRFVSTPATTPIWKPDPSSCPRSG